MMKKRITKHLIVFLTGSVLLGCSSPRPGSKVVTGDNTISESEENETTSPVAEQESETEPRTEADTKLETETEIETETIYPDDLAEDDYFGRYLYRANDEQKEKLQALIEKNGDHAEERIREIKIIMGEISEDTPRITVEDAMKICNDYKPSDGLNQDQITKEIGELFNKVAGAPDIMPVDDFALKYFYYIDDEGTEEIGIALGVVNYQNNIDGTIMVIRDPLYGRAPGTIISDKK